MVAGLEEEQAAAQALRKALLESVFPSALAPRDTTSYCAPNVAGNEENKARQVRARARELELMIAPAAIFLFSGCERESWK